MIFNIPTIDQAFNERTPSQLSSFFLQILCYLNKMLNKSKLTFQQNWDKTY